MTWTACGVLGDWRAWLSAGVAQALLNLLVYEVEPPALRVPWVLAFEKGDYAP